MGKKQGETRKISLKKKRYLRRMLQSNFIKTEVESHNHVSSHRKCSPKFWIVLYHMIYTTIHYDVLLTDVKLNICCFYCALLAHLHKYPKESTISTSATGLK